VAALLIVRTPEEHAARVALESGLRQMGAVADWVAWAASEYRERRTGGGARRAALAFPRPQTLTGSPGRTRLAQTPTKAHPILEFLRARRCRLRP
jgi:hypothetical protein